MFTQILRSGAALGLLGLGLTLGAGPLAAQTAPIDETRPLRAGAAVEVRVHAHSVLVERWDRNEIRITGSYEQGWEEVSIRGSDQALRFEIRMQDRRGSWSRRGSSELRVQLPADVRLSVATLSGAVQVSGLNGSVAAETLSGRVTVSGNLDRVELNSMSGALSFTGNAPIVRLRSVSGNATANGASGRVEITSVSGRSTLSGDWDRAEVSSVSGDIEVTSNRSIQDLRVNSVSGSAAVSGALASSGSLNIEVHSGRIELTLPSSTSARWNLSTFSGRLDVEVPGRSEDSRSQGRYTPEQNWTFSTGAGSGRIELNSFAGTIRVRAR